MADSGKKKTIKKKTTAKKKTASKAVKKKTSSAVRKKTTKKVPAKGAVKKVSKKAPVKKSAKKVSNKATIAKKKAVKKTSKNKAPKNITPKKTKTDVVPVEDELDPAALSRGDEPMGVVDHLEEFRSRILIILATLIVLTIAGISFSDYLIEFLNKPFVDTGKQLNIFKLTGGFWIRLKASAVVAILLTMPLIFFQIWRFVVPAISKDDRMFSRLSLLAAILLFYGGMAFVFFGLVPMVISVLLQFIPQEMVGTIGADDYMSFVFFFSIAMGILFELPIVVLILTRMGILTPAFLITKRKYSIVGIFIISALITPQDPLSMVVVAIPLWFLYEISIVISRFAFMRKAKKNLKG